MTRHPLRTRTRTPSAMTSHISLRTLWLGAGWVGVAMVVYFSLVPDPPQIDMAEGDKVQHLAAYAGLMLWFAQVMAGRTQRAILVWLLVALGVALELAQGLTGYRSMSLADMAANTAGVILGWLAAPPRLPNAFGWVTMLLSRVREARD
jgi:VanZ family protein